MMVVFVQFLDLSAILDLVLRPAVLKTARVFPKLSLKRRNFLIFDKFLLKNSIFYIQIFVVNSFDSIRIILISIFEESLK